MVSDRPDPSETHLVEMVVSASWVEVWVGDRGYPELLEQSKPENHAVVEARCTCGKRFGDKEGAFGHLEKMDEL